MERNLNKRSSKFLNFFGIHTHQWRQTYYFENKNRWYSHEKYHCTGCNLQMHVFRNWDRLPSLKIMQRK